MSLSGNVSATIYKWTSGTSFSVAPSSEASRLYTLISISDQAFGVSTAKFTLLNPNGINVGTWSEGDHLKIVSNNTVLFYGKADIPRYSRGGFEINVSVSDSRAELKRIEIPRDNPQVYPLAGDESNTNTIPKVVKRINASVVAPVLSDYSDAWTFSVKGPPHYLTLTRSSAGTAIITVAGVSIDRAFLDIGNFANYTFYVDSGSFASVNLYLVPNVPGAMHSSSAASYGVDDFYFVTEAVNQVKSNLLWDVVDNTNWSWTGKGRMDVNFAPAEASEYLFLNSRSWGHIGSNSNCISEAMFFFDEAGLRDTANKWTACVRADTDANGNLDTFYGIQLQYGSTNNCKLLKRNNGTYTTLNTTSVNVSGYKQQHILAISARNVGSTVRLRGYVDHELVFSYDDTNNVINAGKPAFFFEGKEGQIDNIRLYPSSVSHTYDVDSGDAIDLSGGKDVTTVYNDVTVYGGISVSGKFSSSDIRNRNPPRPMGQATDQKSIQTYGKRSLQLVSLATKTDVYALKLAQTIVHDYKKPRVIKTIRIPGTTNLPQKFEELVRIVSDNTGTSGLYWVKSINWTLSDRSYEVTLVCEERFLE